MNAFVEPFHDVAAVQFCGRDSTCHGGRCAEQHSLVSGKSLFLDREPVRVVARVAIATARRDTIERVR
jgi:hypothetical protein